jgi:hypothetical protein
MFLRIRCDSESSVTGVIVTLMKLRTFTSWAASSAQRA